jgi:MoaA/NifB/PqqE/SkfB family radical SAM enzyme
MNDAIEKMYKSKFLCIMPWVNFLVAPNGDIRLCCKSNFKEYNMGNIRDFDPKKGINTDEIIKVRKKIIEGRSVVQCQTCFDSEKNGERSLRKLLGSGSGLDYYSKIFGYKNIKELIGEIIDQNGKWTKTPFFLDIKPGNICNLQCRMCGPASTHRLHKKNQKNQMIEWLGDEENFRKITHIVKNVVHLKIGGGEPTIMKSTFKLLDYCVNEKYSKKMMLDINTNGTNVSTLYKYLDYFKIVNIIFSIDGIGEIFEYIRFPAKWEKIEKNFINTLKLKNIQISVNLVVQLLNIFTIEDYIDWVDRMSEINTFSVNVLLLDKPSYYSVYLLDKKTRFKIAENIRLKIKKSKNINQKTIDYFLSLSNKLEQDGFEEQRRKEIFEKFFIVNGHFDDKRKQRLPEKLSKLKEEGQKCVD